MSGGRRVMSEMSNYVLRQLKTNADDVVPNVLRQVRLVDAKASHIQPTHGRRVLYRMGRHRMRTQPARPPHIEVAHRLGMAVVLFPANKVLLPFKVEGLPPLTNKPAGRIILG